jgi:hypothetical protein
MAFKFRPFWVSAVLTISLGALGCSGGSGNSGGYAPAADCTGGTTAQPGPASDYSSMLVGRWVGEMAGETDHDIEFFGDGTCNWSSDYYYDEVGPVPYVGWTWSLFGKEELPDFGAPWTLRLSPPATDATATASTYRIVTIVEAGFTVYDDIEGNDIFMEMKRVP